MTNNKIKVLFVGSFKEMSRNGHVGGQMFACKNILQSNLSEKVEWILLDSTADSNVNPLFVIRLLKAIKRIILFSYLLLAKRPKISLIFTANGWSFLEKGIMVYLSKICQTKVTLAPRAGTLLEEIKNKSWFQKYLTSVFNQADVVICQSASWKENFKQITKLPEHKFKVVHNCIDVTKYHQIIHPKTILNESKIKIIFLGWVERSKGIFELIKAILKIKNIHSNIKLIILGNGKDFDESMQMVHDYNLEEVIEFKSWLFDENKIKELQTSHIFALPSYAEGFPNALLEAMACGLAPVVTSVGAIPDIIQHKVNGWIIPPKNENALIEALNFLIENNQLRKEMGRIAQETVTNFYSLETGVNAYKQIFEKLENVNNA